MTVKLVAFVFLLVSMHQSHVDGGVYMDRGMESDDQVMNELVEGEKVPTATTVEPTSETTSQASADSGASNRTKVATKPPGFYWTVETDGTTLSFARRHIVGTVLHSIFLSGLIICCVVGVSGIIYRKCTGQPLVEKFAPN